MKRLSARIPMKAIYSKGIFKTQRALREAEKNGREKQKEAKQKQKQKWARRNSRLIVLRAAWSPEG
ncbi:hypothetical protein BDZ89DRAFT_1075409 [Hymenopellis radicata]|nr:hypothetical protein BDZ89DRAFT_1075409 [Hymenopellis radicata]